MAERKEIYRVFIPNSPDRLRFDDLKELRKFLDSPQGKSPGVRFKKCREDQFNQLDEVRTSSIEAPSTSTINEPILPYKSLKAPRLNELKRYIEQKNNAKFDELVAENPYFIINMSGDTPTIIQSGCWYNCLHVACRVGNLHVVQTILRRVMDLNWLTNAYGTNIAVENRSKFLLEAFLNTPDKSENNTPLHYACKYGYVELVEALLNYSECLQWQKNKYGETPSDIICQAYKGESKSKITDEINQKFHQKIFIALYRMTDNIKPARLVLCDNGPLSRIPEADFKLLTDSPSNGRAKTLIRRLIDSSNVSFSPGTTSYGSQGSNSSTPLRNLEEFQLSAYAGPFKQYEMAENFYQKWISESVDLRRRDPEKGYEIIGRRLARLYAVNFVENISFLGGLTNLNTIKGLQILEDYLRGLYEKLSKVKLNYEFDPEKLSDELNKLLHIGDDLSINSDEAEVDTFYDSRDHFSDKYESDEENEEAYETPPETPSKSPEQYLIIDHPIYVHNDVPTRDDNYLVSILDQIDSCIIERFPCISSYLKQMKKIPENLRSGWPGTDSPRIQNYVSSAKRPLNEIRGRLFKS